MTVEATKLDEAAVSSPSFRRSYISQPPTTHLTCLEERINGYGLPRIELETHTGLEDVDGITFGHVLDYVEEKRKGWDEMLTELSADNLGVHCYLLRFACLSA